MRHYFEASAVGVGVGSFVIAFYLAFYWHPEIIITILVQAALQGIISVIIYNILRIPILFQRIVHAVSSYLLALLSFLISNIFTGLLSFWSFTIFTIFWIAVFVTIVTYFYFREKNEAQEINEKLNRRKENENYKS
ncbi:MAG: DUF3021 domain-containing protein [Streptococcaceae bacterium]|jgi:predicted membrane protein|nr:DUF3021 domain-containing protein [Streptococcaceae bacterium]